MHSAPSPFVRGDACYAYACLFHHSYFVFDMAMHVCITCHCPLFQAGLAMRMHACHSFSSSFPPISYSACCFRRPHPPSTATMLLSSDVNAMPPPSVFHRLLLCFRSADGILLLLMGWDESILLCWWKFFSPLPCVLGGGEIFSHLCFWGEVGKFSTPPLLLFLSPLGPQVTFFQRQPA